MSRSLVRSVWGSRSLLRAFVATSYKLRYRQSALGLAWALIPVVATLAVGVLVFHRVAGIGTGDVPYPLVTLAALAPWAVLAGTLQFGVPSLALAQPLISRLAFERAVLPLSMLGTALVDLGVSLGAFLIAMAVYGRMPPPTVLWVPILLAVEIVLVSGLVLLGSAMNVFARDLRLLVPALLQLWLFATPVMYPLAAVPQQLRGLYLLNPMTGLVEAFRRALLYGSGPTAELLVAPVVAAVVAFAFGAWYFGAVEPRFADVA